MKRAVGSRHQLGAVSPRPAASAGAGDEALPDGVDVDVALDGSSALIRTSWIRRQPIDHLVAVLRSMQRRGAFRWATPEGLQRAAAHTDISAAGPFVRYVVDLRTIAMMGLPPMSAAMIERAGDGLTLALRAGNVADDSDLEYPLGPDDLGAAYRALERYIGLAPKHQPRLASITIRAGTVLLKFPDPMLATIFGRAAWEQWKTRPPTSVSGASAMSVSSELTLGERTRIERFCRDGLGLAAGPTPIDRSVLELVDAAESDPALVPAIRAELERAGGSGSGPIDVFRLSVAIDRARFERDRGALGFAQRAVDARPSEAFRGFDIPTRVVQKGLAFPGRPVTLALELDWQALPVIGKTEDERAAFANRPWHAEVEWAFERIDVAGGQPERATQKLDREGIAHAHTFRLGPQETTGRWRVHAFLRTSHFEPKHVTTTVVVATEDQRMADLRDDAMGDLAPDAAMWLNHRFDIGWRHEAVKSIPLDGHDADREGYAISGPLPTGWKPRSPDARASARHDEIERYRRMIDYLRKQQTHGEVGHQTAIEAAERQLERLVDADRTVGEEQGRGWRPFELRGTYLSRIAEVPSGPLDLYASVTTELHLGRPLRIKVKIRDVTKRVASDLEVTGEGEHFDEALQRAFVDLCKAYPEGKMTVLGEDHGLDPLMRLVPTGRMIGYELPTTSAWKRVTSKVYAPEVQALLNAAAMAVMIVFPPAAGVVVPMLSIADIVHNLDDIVTRRDQGPLSASTVMVDLAAIGLDVLPMLRSARMFQSTNPLSTARGWRLWTFDAGNFVGQTLVMTERTRTDLAALQDRLVGELAERYRRMIQLQEHAGGNEAELAALRAEIDADAKSIRDSVATTWTNAAMHHAAMFVGPQLLGGHAPASPRHEPDAAPGRTVEVGRRDRGAQGGDPDVHVRGPSDRYVLAGDDARLRAAARRAQPRPGYIDVIVHGTAESFWVVRGEVELPVDHRALATYLRKQGLSGSMLRLIACEAGHDRFAIARDLARKLQMEVLAPSTTAWIDATGYVGVGPRDVDQGKWITFPSKPDSPDSRRGRPGREPYRERDPLRMPDGSEVDEPVHVAAPRVDRRARVRTDQLETLSRQLGAKVVIDAELHNGVEVHAVQRKGLLGYDLDAIEIRAGVAALQSDVLAHAETVRDLRRYNGLLGKLRALADRLLRGRDPSRPSFPPGTRGHVTERELGKLDQLIAQRQAQHASGLIDAATLADELAFLRGQVAFHTETLQSLGDAGFLRDSALTLGGPDIGAVTREAQAQGYKLPGEVKGAAGEHADPAHYYYRRAMHDATVFEVARKPSAPADAPAFRARVVNGKFVGLVDGAVPAPKEVVPVGAANPEVVARLRETEGFGPYADMLEQHGIASRAVIDAAVTTMRGRKNQAGDEVTLDWLRHEVKSHFRERVERKLLDPALDERASFANMRAMLDGLGNSDRGNLAEVWYRARHARGGDRHRKYQVTRTSGDSAGQVETRVADLVVSREAREVKDIEGKIDTDQLAAYADLLRDAKLREAVGIDRLRYVFTKPEGAIANLRIVAEAMSRPDLAMRLTIEVFDRHGRRHIVTTPTEARALLAALKGTQ
jgi:hypothetical protein